MLCPHLPFVLLSAPTSQLMRPRQNLTDLFSTFLQFEADRFSRWATDTRLRRSMQQCTAQFPDATLSEEFWSVYWHKRWQGEEAAGNGKGETHAKALGHLSAYLQESCYWSIQKVMPRLQGSQYKLSDCFQVAIANAPKILNTFDSDQSASLKTYASTAFGNILRDYLRQRREIDMCNDWGLLLKLSRKRLTEALQNAGLDTDLIQRYLLAWTCFQTGYIPTKSPGLRKLVAPDAATWSTIAQLYNTQRRQLASPGTDCTPETLERWLTYCATQTRAYLYPAMRSLNTPKAADSSTEWQDDLPDTRQESLLAELVQQEERRDRQAQRGQLNTFLTQALDKLDPGMRDLLQCYYQQQLTQQQIAQRLNLQQYAVSRKLSKARERLLLDLTRWSQETLHIVPSSNVVKSISAVLEEWLQAHYQATAAHLSENAK